MERSSKLMLWEPTSTRQSRPTIPSPWISAPTELSSCDLATKCHVFSTGNKVKYSQLGEANGVSSFKFGEIRSTNEWKIALPSIESNREC
jgi:hypothetical protein